MGLITDAKAFVDRLLHPRDERQCPRCGSTLTKKNGGRRRSPRDLGGIRSVRIQRHWCYPCTKGYDEELSYIAPHHWYTRRVQRKYLDMYTTIGGSLRRCASWITAEMRQRAAQAAAITGRGRTFIWDLSARAPWWGRAPEPEPEIELPDTGAEERPATRAAGAGCNTPVRPGPDVSGRKPMLMCHKVAPTCRGAMPPMCTFAGSRQPFSVLLTGLSERPLVCSI